jgi:hypothetical protein
MTTVVDINKMDFEKLKFAPNKSNAAKKFVKVFYDKKPFIFKLPKSKIPFHAQLNQYSKHVEFCLNVAKEHQEFFETLDKKALEVIDENNYEVDFIPVLKHSTAGFDPLLKVKVLPNSNDNTFPDLFDHSKNTIQVSSAEDFLKLLKGRNHMISAIECSGLWVINGKAGLTFKLYQGRLFQTSNSVSNEDYLFDDSDSGESLQEALFDE